ncbi:hypothetical protein [Paraburkholderia antibiotica]|uniref:Uncharacterized protein n=1 Tax=Paraburkholderia antibiotica TaxID=2728839 RepID=A0A7Y0FFY0_9BURK|nr:hypothetical protein [Paraburkholderia antibiotica]NML34519.1 hypothetical protein [Paraburkholderia antibiotica]
MALPRHLRDKFNGSDGTPIAEAASGSAGTNATSDPAAQQAMQAAGEQGDDAGAFTGLDGDALHDAAHVDDGATSSQQLNANAQIDGDASTSNAGDENLRRMEGRYKAEITRLRGLLQKAEEAGRGTSQITDLLVETRQELAEARRQLTELQTGGASSVQPSGKQGTSSAAESQLPDLSDEELAMYGDFTPVAEKLIARATAPLLKEIAELRDGSRVINEQMGQSAEQLFVRDVAARVPQMQSISKSQEWQDFLQQPIPLTSLKIQDALMEAHQGRNLAGVVAIFNAFGKTQGASQHQQADASTQSAANGATGASSSTDANGLGQFATPARTSSNGTARPAAKFKESDYRKRMEDMRMQRITKAEFMKFEQEFQEARARGLVSNT